MVIAGDSYGDVSRQELAAEAQRRAGLETALSRMLATANRMGDVRRDDVRYREQLAARELADQENRAYRDRAFRYMQESDLANRWGREDQQAAARDYQDRALAQQERMARENQQLYRDLNEASTRAATQQRTDAEAARQQAEDVNLAFNIANSGGTVPTSLLNRLPTERLDVLASQIDDYNTKVDLASKQNEAVASAINARLNAVAPPLSPAELEQVAKLQSEITNLPANPWFWQRGQKDAQSELKRITGREAERAKQASDLLRGSEDLQRRVMYQPGVGFTPVELPRRSALPGVPNRPVERISDLTGPELPTESFRPPEYMFERLRPVSNEELVPSPPYIPRSEPQSSGPLPDELIESFVRPSASRAVPAAPNEVPEMYRAMSPDDRMRFTPAALPQSMMPPLAPLDGNAYRAALEQLTPAARAEANLALREEIARVFNIGPEPVGPSALRLGRSPASVVQQKMLSDPYFLDQVNALDPAITSRIYRTALQRAEQNPRGWGAESAFRFMGRPTNEALAPVTGQLPALPPEQFHDAASYRMRFERPALPAELTPGPQYTVPVYRAAESSPFRYMGQ